MIVREICLLLVGGLSDGEEKVLKKLIISLYRYCFIFLLVFGGTPLHAEDEFKFDCLIEPHSVVDVSTFEDATIMAEVLVGRGDVIKKGQALARLESNVASISVDIATARAKMHSKIDSAQARVKYLRAQKSRIDKLHKNAAVSFDQKQQADTDHKLAVATLQEAKSNYELAQLEQKRAEQILERRTIRSLIDGVVIKISVDAGESVEDRPIMTIAEVDPLNVEVILPENMYGSVNIGTRAEVIPLVKGGEKVIIKVVVVDKVIDAASNTFGVRLELENKDYKIPGGVRCDVNFILDEV